MNFGGAEDLIGLSLLSPDGDFLYLHRTGLPGELISLHLLSKSLGSAIQP